MKLEVDKIDNEDCEVTSYTEIPRSVSLQYKRLDSWTKVYEQNASDEVVADI